MDIGHFYFINNQYFIDFPDKNLMKNRETINGIVHDRPCLYAFQETATGIYWTVPFSSKVSKYKQIYQNKVVKYGKCDTIDFGYVLGHEKVFLIQNMCPVSDKYINNEYISNNVPVQLDFNTQQRIIKKAKKILQLQRKGLSLVFPDVLYIESQLIKQQNLCPVS